MRASEYCFAVIVYMCSNHNLVCVSTQGLASSQLTVKGSINTHMKLNKFVIFNFLVLFFAFVVACGSSNESTDAPSPQENNIRFNNIFTTSKYYPIESAPEAVRHPHVKGLPVLN